MLSTVYKHSLIFNASDGYSAVTALSIMYVSKDTGFYHRNMQIFLTNYGPFSAYSYQFGRVLSPLCVYGGHAKSLILYQRMFINIVILHRNVNTDYITQWISHVLKRHFLIEKIIYCVTGSIVCTRDKSMHFPKHRPVF